MRALFSVLVVAVGTTCLVGAGGGNPAEQPPLVINSMVGRDLFQFYCATCHGSDGKGAGPLAPSLRTRPADLTQIARHNGGRFPHVAIVRFIDGTAPVAAHGSPDMPVWGPIFRALDRSDARAKIRIENLASYLETIQVK
jgi:mono/diheme cytochrome c family protein